MRTAGWLIPLAAALMAWQAHAQSQMRYQCRAPNGAVYLSDRPCANVGADGSSRGSTPPVYYGPTEPQNTYRPPMAGVGEAPEYIQYMSPRCSGLHDALRTAQARGLESSTMSEMRKNYQRECSENEAEARNQYSRDRGEKRQMARTEKDAENRARQLTELQAQQCGESKRILVMKKQRTDLTEGEKADLQRFETNYRARCT